MNPKIVLVTGCSSGIGFELLAPLLERGYVVFASLRNLEERLSLFADLHKKFPCTLFLIEMDVTKPADREAALQRIEQTHGALDLLINNAGFGVFGPLEEAPEADVREQFETNLFGPLFLSKAALPLLRRSKGRIISISSILGEVGMPFTSLYCSSKFALEGLFESLAHETKSHGVQVALVLPGGHKTRFFENRRRRLNESSPYSREAEKILHMMSAGSGGLRGTPESVVRKVLGLIDRERMPLRTHVGLDALAIHYLHSLLPQFIFQPLLRTGIRISARL